MIMSVYSSSEVLSELESASLLSITFTASVLALHVHQYRQRYSRQMTTSVAKSIFLSATTINVTLDPRGIHLRLNSSGEGFENHSHHDGKKGRCFG